MRVHSTRFSRFRFWANSDGIHMCHEIDGCFWETNLGWNCNVQTAIDAVELHHCEAGIIKA